MHHSIHVASYMCFSCHQLLSVSLVGQDCNLHYVTQLCLFETTYHGWLSSYVRCEYFHQLSILNKTSTLYTTLKQNDHHILIM